MIGMYYSRMPAIAGLERLMSLVIFGIITFNDMTVRCGWAIK